MKVKVKLVSNNSEAPAPAQPVPIHTPEIPLASFLKLCNAVESGGQAKEVIQGGQVRVNGETCLMRGRKLKPGDTVRFAGGKYLVAEEEPPCTS